MKKILIIEDNLSVRENLAEILELSNYEVITAENGKIGVEQAFSSIPDIILCDVMMPELDGYGVLKILNSNPKTRDIPFLFLTAKTEKDDFRRGMGLGADDYISKPFDDVALLEAIEMRLNKSTRIRKSFNTVESGRQLFLDEGKAKEELIKLTEGREIRKYQKKDLIFEEGHFPTWLFYLTRGHVKVLKTNDYGKDLITRIYRPGEFFGFLSLIKNGSYQESAKAISDCEVKLVPKISFFELLHNNRDFSAQFIKILASEILQLEEKLIELAYSSVRKKVANALLHLYEKMEDKDHHIIILREDLASLAGTAKETVIRTLADFKDEKLIDIVDHDIIITNSEKLKKMPQ